MEPLSYFESILIATSPEKLYELVSDVTRTGEWSPICKECWWLDGDGPREGAWFAGRNESNGRVWETKSLVEVAEPGVKFAWLVGGTRVRWAYTIEPVAAGARLTETWEFLPDGIALFHDKYKEDAHTQIEERTRAARTGIPATLSAIKKIAEAESRHQFIQPPAS